MPRKNPPVPVPIEDAWIAPEVGAWADDKHRYVWLYQTLVSSGMKNKWRRVYVDLYAAAGVSTIRGSHRRIFGSPLLALQVQDPFDHYVFCEENPTLFQALRARVSTMAPSASVILIQGSCDDKVTEISEAIYKGSKGQQPLTLCFVDPFGMDISFRTLAALAAGRTDFLILLMGMDATRNQVLYAKENSQKIDRFLDTTDWRGAWETAQSRGTKFPAFLADTFSSKMKGLGYLEPPPMKTIRNTEKKAPLYKLAIFSKHPKAHDFWDQVLKYAPSTKSLF